MNILSQRKERSVIVAEIMSKAIKKIVEEARDKAYTELDLADREIKSLNSVPILRKLRQTNVIGLRYKVELQFVFIIMTFELKKNYLFLYVSISYCLVQLRQLTKLTLSHNKLTGTTVHTMSFTDHLISDKLNHLEFTINLI